MPMSNFSIRQIAQQCGVSVRTVRAWIRAGELKAVNMSRTPGSRKPRWRVTQAALDAFLALRTSRPSAPAPRSRRKTAAEDFSFY
jgi:excisionase family DNA binding protein